MFVKPSSAPVGCPSVVASSSGSAKYARYARLLPSTTKRSHSRAGASSRSSSTPVSVFGTSQRYRRGPMPGLEIHPLSELRDEAAALLAERFAKQRQAQPLLPEVDSFETHLPELGHVATRDGKAVAYLGGSVDESAKMARWLFAGHAAREPDALRDLFAHQSAAFGVSRFMVTVPATDEEL